MKVSCLQENLAKGLSIVGRAVASRSTLPVLANVLLAIDNGQLKLAATNLEIGINCWVGAKIEEEGAITVPARLLADFVNSLPPERIDLVQAGGPGRQRKLIGPLKRQQPGRSGRVYTSRKSNSDRSAEPDGGVPVPATGLRVKGRGGADASPGRGGGPQSSPDRSRTSRGRGDG